MAGPVFPGEGEGSEGLNRGAHADCFQAEYLTKILFTRAHCLCHDVNKLTKSPSHIDVVMGFSTGEVIWWEPITQRYTRLNKNVCASIRKPNARLTFIVCHQRHARVAN